MTARSLLVATTVVGRVATPAAADPAATVTVDALSSTVLAGAGPV